MAAVCTHYLFALEFSNRHSDVFKVKKLNKNALFWGTQGPDIFFFHRAVPVLMPGKSLNKVGSKLHRTKPSDFFGAVADYMGDHDSDILRSYVSGLILHYALDRNIHPYVFALQDKIVKEVNIKYNPSIVHNWIETNIDIIMLREKLGISGTEFRPSDTLVIDKGVICEVSCLYSYVIEHIMGNVYKSEQIEKAFYDTHTLQSLMSDASGRKRKTVRTIEKLPFVPPFFSTLIRTASVDKSVDFGNLSHNQWTALDAPGIVRTDSVFDIFDAAQYDALMLTNGFFSGKRDKESLSLLTDELLFDAGEKPLK